MEEYEGSEDPVFQDTLRQMRERAQEDLCHFRGLNVTQLKAQAMDERDEFVERVISKAGPSKELRLIDIRATCGSKSNKIILVDYSSGMSYTAISHTYGLAVYKVFDCACASDSSACRVPRHCSSEKPSCTSTVALATKDYDQNIDASFTRHSDIIEDILKMCHRLMGLVGRSELQYVWHDGVCIAQHDTAELEETIKHMGWIYANAVDTVIFLHYVGTPMAPIRNGKDVEQLTSRWQTRVWTLQEAVVSRRRRYCVRMMQLRHLLDYKLAANGDDDRAFSALEAAMDAWHSNDENIAVIEEDVLWESLLEMLDVLVNNCMTPAVLRRLSQRRKAILWMSCILSWLRLLTNTSFRFPRLEEVLVLGAAGRDSKHVGDRINSILGLAGITDFVAPKDHNFETSTIEFFNRLGQQGLQLALVFINNTWDEQDEARKSRSWVPSLARRLTRFPSLSQEELAQCTKTPAWYIRYAVIGDGMLKMKGKMRSVAVQFFIRSSLRPREPSIHPFDCFCESYQDAARFLNRVVAMELYDINVSESYHRAVAYGTTTVLGYPIIPSVWHDSQFVAAVIRGQCVNEGESFSGHLVFGAFTHLSSPRVVLIVSSHKTSITKLEVVSQIGWFYASSEMLDFVSRGLIPSTYLEQLILE